MVGAQLCDPRDFLCSINELGRIRFYSINSQTTGNPFLGTKLLGFSIGRGLGAPKGFIRIEWSLIARRGGGHKSRSAF